MLQIRLHFLTALLTTLLCSASQAQTTAAPRNGFELTGVAATWQMQTRSDYLTFGPASTAPPVDVESTLRAPRRGNITGLSFGRLIGERWRVEVAHSRSQRSGLATLGADLDVGGITYLSGTVLASDIKLTTLAVNGGLALIKNEGAELGLSLGGMWTRTSLHTDGITAYASGAVPANRYASDGGDTVPTLLLGGFGHWDWGPHWRLQGRAAFGVDGERHSQLSVAAQWRPNPHLGIGLGYRYTETELDMTHSFIGTSRLQLKYRAHGPMLSMALGF